MFKTEHANKVAENWRRARVPIRIVVTYGCSHSFKTINDNNRSECLKKKNKRKKEIEKHPFVSILYIYIYL